MEATAKKLASRKSNVRHLCHQPLPAPLLNPRRCTDTIFLAGMEKPVSELEQLRKDLNAGAARLSTAEAAAAAASASPNAVSSGRSQK